MTSAPRRTSRAASLVAAACLGCALLAAAAPASAQPIRPWVPASADSLLAWGAEARAKFRTNAGDSVGGANYEAYALVSRMGRRLLRSLGRANTVQAHAVETVLDSLGLDTDVAIDPRQPTFILLMVRNPFRATAGAAGFLYWYRGDDLRVQGVAFRGGFDPSMRVWWTANSTRPYECAILYRLTFGGSPGFMLLKLGTQGVYWGVDQYEGAGPDLADAHEATLADINGDLRPELLAWARVPADSMFELCRECPPLITERVYTEGPQGFELHDSRLLPSALANFTLFIRLLHEQNRAAAARLLTDPKLLEQAIANDWGAGRARGLWKVEYVESDRQWPTWLALRFHGPKGVQRWIVHFTQKDGRWAIKDWLPVKPSRASAPSQGVSDSAGVDRARGPR